MSENLNLIRQTLRNNNIVFKEFENSIIIDSEPEVKLFNFYEDEWSLSIEGYNTGSFFHSVEMEISVLLEVVVSIAKNTFKIKKVPFLKIEYLEVKTKNGTNRFRRKL